MFDTEIFRRAGDHQAQGERGPASQPPGQAASALAEAAQRPVLQSFASAEDAQDPPSAGAGAGAGTSADEEAEADAAAANGPPEPEIMIGEADLARLLAVAWQKGLDEGSRKEAENQEARKAAACDALVTGVERCVAALAESRALLERRFADTACAVVRSVASAFRLHARADILRGCIEDRLTELRDADRIVLAVHPETVALIRDDVLPSLPADHQRLGFEIEARPEMSTGALEIDWQRSWSDFDFARLESGLQTLFDRHWRATSEVDAAPNIDEGNPP